MTPNKGKNIQTEKDKNFILSAIAFFLASATVFFAACDGNKARNVEKGLPGDTLLLKPEFAQGYAILKKGGKTWLEVYDPWNHTGLLASFLLIEADDEAKQQPDFTLKNTVEIPVEQFLALSATQWGMLLQLEVADKIVGISEAPYVRNGQMRAMIDQEKVVEVARDGFFRYELLSRFQGAAMLYSPDAAGLPAPLQQLDLRLIPWPDFAEPHPLGRAEWIRLAGFLAGKEHQADSIFSAIKTEYQRLSRLVSQAKHKPTIFSDKLFAGQWYVPGGKSYLAKIFEDAGADYLFDDVDARGSVPLDPEAVFARASNADFWRIAHAGNIGGYDGLAAENPIYQKFNAFQKRRIIYCNTIESEYFERGPLEPHQVLADFIAIFHPDLLPSHRPRYHYLLR